MKLLFILLTVASSFSITHSYASETVSPAVLKSFKESFHQVKNVTWVVNNDVYKAAFDLDGQQLTAFYNADGKLLSISKKSTVQQLPVILQRDLKKLYTDYRVTEVAEITDNSKTDYYVVLENEGKKIILKSKDHVYWSVYSKTHK